MTAGDPVAPEPPVPEWGSAPETGERSSAVPPWGTPPRQHVPEGSPEAGLVPAWGTPPAGEPPNRRSVWRSKGAWAWLAAAVGTGVAVVIGVTGGGSVTLDQLKVGDCVQASADGTLDADIPVVACTDVHQEEVFAVFDLPGGAWPSGDAAEDAVYSKCQPLFASYGGVPAANSLIWYGPTREEWANGDRRIVCAYQTLPGSSTSVKGPALRK
jgi:Septum formation